MLINSLSNCAFFLFVGMVLLGGGALGFDFAKGRVRPLHKDHYGDPCTDLKERSRWRYLGHAIVAKRGQETNLVFLSPLMTVSRRIIVIEYPPFGGDLEPDTVLTVKEGKLTCTSEAVIMEKLVIGLN